MQTKLTIILLLTLLPSFVSNSQTSNDLFKTPGAKVIWLGIDYSHVKIIGDISATQNLKLTIDEIKETYFLTWNKLILEEDRKYDIRNIFRSRSVQKNIEFINRTNAEAPAEDFADTETPHYDKNKIEEFLESYTFGLKGIGLLLIAESLDETNGVGIYHFVAINLNDKNSILVYDRINGKAGGEGFRNYWARSYYNVMMEITEKRYPTWKKNPDSRIKKD